DRVQGAVEGERVDRRGGEVVGVDLALTAAELVQRQQRRRLQVLRDDVRVEVGGRQVGALAGGPGRGELLGDGVPRLDLHGDLDVVVGVVERVDERLVGPAVTAGEAGPQRELDDLAVSRRRVGGGGLARSLGLRGAAGRAGGQGQGGGGQQRHRLDGSDDLH